MKAVLMVGCWVVLAGSAARAQTPEKMLLQAYKNNSVQLLDSFFEHWGRDVNPLIRTAAAEARLNDTLRDVYAVFQAFYTPLNIERLGGSEFGPNIYDSVHYLLVQSEISYGFVDTLDADAKTRDRTSWPPTPRIVGNISGFYPSANYTSPKPLILTPYYDHLLARFLGDKHVPLGSRGIMAPAAARDESRKRQQFLEQRIKIFYGHWGGYWQLQTYPVAMSIIFDRKLSAAVVNYQIIYEGGYAFFKKINSTWTMVAAKRTWIE